MAVSSFGQVAILCALIGFALVGLDQVEWRGGRMQPVVDNHSLQNYVFSLHDITTLDDVSLIEFCIRLDK